MESLLLTYLTCLEESSMYNLYTMTGLQFAYHEADAMYLCQVRPVAVILPYVRHEQRLVVNSSAGIHRLPFRGQGCLGWEGAPCLRLTRTH